TAETLEAGLEPPAPTRGAQEAALDQREERGGDFLGAPGPRRVVPLVDPVEHAQEPEDDEARRRLPEDAAPDDLDHDRLDALVVAVLLRRQLTGEAGGQAGLLAEEHRQERPVGDDETDVLPDHAAELLVGRQTRAQHEPELPREALDRLA